MHSDSVNKRLRYEHKSLFVPHYLVFLFCFVKYFQLTKTDHPQTSQGSATSYSHIYILSWLTLTVSHAGKFGAFLRSYTSKNNKTNVRKERDACKINYSLPSLEGSPRPPLPPPNPLPHTSFSPSILPVTSVLTQLRLCHSLSKSRRFPLCNNNHPNKERHKNNRSPQAVRRWCKQIQLLRRDRRTRRIQSGFIALYVLR